MPHTDINLLPESQKNQVRTSPVLSWFNRIGIYVLIFVYVVVIAGYGFRWFRENELKQMRGQVATQIQKIENEQEFVAKYEAMQKDYRVLGAVVGAIKPKSQYLTLLKETIPVTVTLTTLDVTDTTINIDAYSTEYGAITQWYNTLQNDDTFSQVDLTAVQRNSSDAVGGGQISFRLLLKIK